METQVHMILADENGKPHAVAIAERILGRELHPWELVSHKNNNMLDFRRANIEIECDFLEWVLEQGN